MSRYTWILGIDPGLDTTGVTLLEHLKPAGWRHSEGWKITTNPDHSEAKRVEHARSAVAALLESILPICFSASLLVAVEGWGYQGARSHTGVGSLISGLAHAHWSTARALGLPAVIIPRTTVLDALGAHSGSKSAAKRLTSVLIKGGLGIPNEHQRDAALVAVVAGRIAHTLEIGGLP